MFLINWHLVSNMGCIINESLIEDGGCNLETVKYREVENWHDCCIKIV